MPCGGSTSGNVEKAADGKSCTISKRSVDKNNKFCQKEHQVSALVLRHPEQGSIIFTLVPLWLAPFLLPVQGSGCRNHLGSGAHPDVDGFGSVSPSGTIIFQVDLQKERVTEAPENSGPAKSFSVQNFGPNSLGHSQKRNKRTKSIKSSSTSSASCSVSDNSSGSVCDSLNAAHSDFLISDISKVENPVKKSSRKKAKKKGKHYKRSSRRKVLIESGTKCEEGISGASLCDNPVNSDSAGSGDHMLENNLSEDTTSSSCSFKDIVMEKGESKVSNNGLIESSTDLMACMSYMCEMDVSEPIASSSQGFAGEEFNCNQLNLDDDSTHLSNTSPQEVILPTMDDNTTNDCPKQDRNSCDTSSGSSLDHSASSLVDSFVDGWNSDSEVCSDDIETRLSIKDENGFSSSESGVDSRINGTHHSVSSTYRSNKVIDTHDSTERVQCGSQACSSNDFQPVVYGKRGRLARKMNVSVNAGSRYYNTNLLGRTAKDSNHSVWQKVQKNDTKEGKRESSNVRVLSKPSNNLSMVPETATKLHKLMGMKQNQSEKICNFFGSGETVIQTDSHAAASSGVGSSELLSKSIDGKLVNDVKRKPNSVSKQTNHYSRKGSHTDKVNIARPSKIQIHQKDESGVSHQVNHAKYLIDGVKSPFSTNFQRLVARPTSKPRCCQSAQKHTEIHVELSTPLENGFSTVQDITSLAAHYEIPSVAEDNQSRPLLALDFLDRACIEEHSDNGNSKSYDNMPVDYCHPTEAEDDGSMKSESESSHADHSKTNSCPGSVMQKWVPVGRKVPMACESVSDSSSQKVLEVDVFSSNAHHSLPFAGDGLECLSPTSEDTDGRSPGADGLSSKFGSHPQTEEQFSGVLAMSNCNLTPEVMDTCQLGSEDDLDVIVRAVTDAYKFQTASENIHQVTGNPVAEFERFLHSATPVLDQIACLKSCETCPQDLLIADSLCPHQIPNFSLGNIWHWYEGPGSYGLEVKAEDYNSSKRYCYGHLEFRAYFVPYLSAVQLFSQTNSSSSDGNSNKELKTSAHLNSLPIFSKLLPQPCKQVDVNLSESSSSTKQELLFEYFESDQPQQRRPLYEKIKELVRGDVSSTGTMFGDPLNLERLNLHDLHPASWYSVAWYPIYRIPDANFRAAFLTYHSLGHFAHGKASPSFFGGVACLVLPVVGLQSYNAQGECWFQPRGLKSQVVQIDETLHLDSSKILEQRLRTLERTASVMARASVWKHDQRYVNKQPDYEFFLSRRR